MAAGPQEVQIHLNPPAALEKKTKTGVNEDNEKDEVYREGGGEAQGGGRVSYTNNVTLGTFNTEPRRPHNNGVSTAVPRLRVARFLSGCFQLQQQTIERVFFCSVTLGSSTQRSQTGNVCCAASVRSGAG